MSSKVIFSLQKAISMMHPSLKDMALQNMVMSKVSHIMFKIARITERVTFFLPPQCYTCSFSIYGISSSLQ